tara:strand:- start:4618 stop:4989 length:372 start_codon:yes stop_codon:yes gene_type:complete
MSRKIDTKKQVFNKTEYEKTIDTRFNDLGTTGIKDAIKETVSTEEFFQLYDELFYELPLLGDNSHEYLVKTSGEYINFDQNSEIIEALQQEITALREENLNKDIQLAEIESGQKFNVTASISE